MGTYGNGDTFKQFEGQHARWAVPRMALGYAAVMTFIAMAGTAVAQTSTAFPAPPVIVVQDDLDHATTPIQKRPSNPQDILGIRIESNGALITGPMNARRTFIPLDRPLIPKAMRGHWARSLAVCVQPSRMGANHRQTVEKDNVLITKQAIIAKQSMHIIQTFVPLPSEITFAMLQSGKPMVLSARRQQKAAEILVIISMPDDTRVYSIMSLSPDRKSIQLQTQKSRETALRCDA